MTAVRGIAAALLATACSSQGSSGSAGDDGGVREDVVAMDGGGGDVAPQDDGGGASVASACADLGAAVCGRLEACGPFLVDLAYGDAATCAMRYAAACTPAFGAHGTTATPSRVEACAQAIRAESCDDALDNGQPAACAITGTLVDAALCASGMQCQAGYCPLISGSACGQCTQRVGVGSACTVDQDCTGGLLCAQGACVTPGGPSAACGPSQPCKLTLGCIGGTCQTFGTSGAACQDTFGCDLEHGGYCNPQTMKCATMLTPGAGQPCGYVGSNFAACISGGLCVNGACVATGAEGAACDAQKGPPCMQPAQCVQGKCMLPDAVACH